MATVYPGLVQIYTGDGKGKTTAAVGLAVRAVGAGRRVVFIQFVKGGPRSSELSVLEGVGVHVERPAVRSTGLLGDGLNDADRRAAGQAWDLAAHVLGQTDYDVVILDEINVAIHYGLVDEEAVLEALAARSPAIDVVLTGRGASETLIERADLVTEMVPVKHPFERGIPARLGIEF